MTAQNRVLLLNLLAASNAELLTNQVQTGNLLGNRVLHLQTGVHLKEGDGAVGTDQELTGAGTLVAGLAQNRAGRLVQALVLLIAQLRRCREQSRVETTTTLPCASARHWVST